MTSLWTGVVGGGHPLFLCGGPGSGPARGCGAIAVLVSQADQESGAQALLRARETLPSLLAWFPVSTRLACLQVSGERGSVQPALCPGAAFLCAWTLGP